MQSALIVAMRDLITNAEKTIYITKHETMFERLVDLYKLANGDIKELEKQFPEYF